jgi:hypothetical protein
VCAFELNGLSSQRIARVTIVEREETPMPKSNNPPKSSIKITILHNGTDFYTSELIDPIGSRGGNKVTWTVYNNSARDVFVSIHSFAPTLDNPKSGRPVGLEDRHEEDFANYKGSAEKLIPSKDPTEKKPKKREFKTWLSPLRGKHSYTYVIEAVDRQTHKSSTIDPELQIDDMLPPAPHFLKSALIAVAVIAALAFGYWLFFM